MKKIILIFTFLLFSLCCQAQSIQVSDIEYKNYINRSLILENNLKKQINTSLNGIELKNSEFVVLSGNLSSNNKLVNYKVKALNISDEKAGLIINKLSEAELTYNFIPDVYNPNIIYDQFTLYIGAKPQYTANKDFVVLINLSNEKLKQEREKYKKIMEEYYEILESKIELEFLKSKTQYEIPNDKILRIGLTIDKKGNLLNSEIISSINSQIDNYMLSAIKKLFPLGKLPDFYDFSVFEPTVSLGGEVIVNRFKQNATSVSLLANYGVIVKILLDKRGNVVSEQIVKSSNNNSIDKEILNTVKKTNFIELINYGTDEQEIYLNIISNIPNVNYRLRDVYMDKTNNISLKHKNLSNWQLGIVPQENNKRNDKPPFDWQPYMLQFQERIKKYWKPPQSNENKRVVTLITLNKYGQVVNRSIASSSGIKEVDNAALRAIDEGAPYQKFPPEADRKLVNIQFTFDYTIFGASGNKYNVNSNDNSSYSYKDLCQGWACKLRP